MGNRRQPEQQPPPVQKLRVRYCKRGRARFTSHRDFSRAFERALRRADIPMALSSGFHQHARISYVNASPTGAASEAEYLEIGLAQQCEPAWVAQALTDALPDGMAVLEVAEASGPSLVQRLTASRWTADVDVPAEVAARAVRAFWDADSVLVTRETKNGLREFDARGAVLALEASEDGLVMALQHGSPLVRPDDVIQGLGRVEPAFAPQRPALLTRVGQGEWRDGHLADPLAQA